MSTDDKEMRDLARRLFGTTKQEPSEPPPAGNHSPSEGDTPPSNDPDAQMRRFVADLFTFTD